MNTQPTYRIAQVIAASDEYTAPIFRAPSGGCSGEWPTKEMVDAGLRRMLGDKQYSAPWEDVIYNMFRAMLAAAPHQAQEAQGDRHA